VSAVPDPEMFSVTLIVIRSFSLRALASSYKLAVSCQSELLLGTCAFASPDCGPWYTYRGGGGGSLGADAQEESNNRMQKPGAGSREYNRQDRKLLPRFDVF